MKLRSILASFLFVFLASFIALYFFVQTRSFGDLLTRVVTDLAQKRFDSKISIDNIEISLFPPGLELNRVRVKRVTESETIKLELGKLGVYLNLIEIEERRISLGEIKLQNSVIEVYTPKSETSTDEIKQSTIDEVFKISERLPMRVDTLLVENAFVKINHDLLEARRLKVFKKGKNFITRFHLANIRPDSDNEFAIDEIWGDLEIGRKSIEVSRLKVIEDVQSILVKGEIRDYRLLKGSRANLKGELNLSLENLDQLLGISKTIRIERGFGDILFDVAIENQEITGSAFARLQDFRSNLAHADTIEGRFRFRPEGIFLEKAELKKDTQYAVLLEPAMVFHIPQKQILPKPLLLKFDQYLISNALLVVPELEDLRGIMSGSLILRHDRGDFYIKPKDGFVARDVSLMIGKEERTRLLTIPQLTLKNTDISVVNKEVRISGEAALPNSAVEVDGFVSKKGLRFSILDAPFDLEDLGNIGRLNLKGKGRLNLNVSGKGKEVAINLTGKMEGFEVLEYRLGTTDVNVTVDLGADSVVIQKMEGLYGSTPISVTGAVNYKNLDIALGINSPGTNYHDLSRILTPIFKKVDFLPEDINFNAKVDASVFGKIRFPDLKVKSTIVYSDLFGYGELINSGSLSLNLENEVLRLQDFYGRKGGGEVRGNFYYDTSRDYLGTKIAWDNLSLTSFNFSRFLQLNIDGKIKGILQGEGKNTDYTLKLDTTLSKTKSLNYDFEDSRLVMDIHPKRYSGNLSFLGSILRSNFTFPRNFEGPTNFTLKASVPKIKPILTALFGEHIESEDIGGVLEAQLEASFMDYLQSVDLRGQLENITFSHPDFNFKYSSEAPDFVIENNQIKKWDLNVQSPDLTLVSRGSGAFGKKVDLRQEVQMNSKILEILLAPVLSADGKLQNEFSVSGLKDQYHISFRSFAQSLNLSLQGLPIPLNQLAYDIELIDRRLLVNKLITSIDNGTASMMGEIYFDDEAPDVNLKYELNRAEIPILNKSAINVSGEGIILGDNLPYALTGDLTLNKALIVNEVNDFTNRSSAFSQVRYLPKNQESILGKLFNLNVEVKAENPIKISNSLMDVSLKGEVRLLGNPAAPKGEGHLYAPPNTSRVFFKNNDYYITSGDLNFFSRKEITNPDFDIQAVTTLSNYKVYAKAYGDLERFNFDLTSEPALPRNSILSLIAFGYTDEIGTLRPDDQQNLTQMGVGSFVLDRFKISDILNKQFGIQVNVGTVFVQSEQSLLAGRSTDSGAAPGDIGRTRSATKIELKKRLDEATSLSVSSTMGGSIGSRQSMNLTYSLTKKIQLEGVYELRTAAEGEEDSINNSNSIGGDLKFRWSFK